MARMTAVQNTRKNFNVEIFPLAVVRGTPAARSLNQQLLVDNGQRGPSRSIGGSRYGSMTLGNTYG
jgi:hypothetical protein